jgi:hypothetical protein
MVSGIAQEGVDASRYFFLVYIIDKYLPEGKWRPGQGHGEPSLGANRMSRRHHTPRLCRQ